MADNVEYLFMCIFTICISTSVKCYFMYWTFSTRIFNFYVVTRFFFLHIQSFLSPFSDTQFTNIFAHSIDCLYIILNTSQNKSFEVDEVSLSTFALIYCAFGIKPNFFFLLNPR